MKRSRSGGSPSFSSTPRPSVKWACGSKSMRRHFFAARASGDLRAMAVTLFPVPPLCVLIEMTLARIGDKS